VSDAKVTVTGVPETVAKFDRLGQLVEDDAAPANQAAQVAASAASSFAPVLTGELASMYQASERFVINPLSYAGFVEYGARGVAPMFPIHRGLDATLDETERIYQQFVEDQIRKAGL
jgi:hypothetical protein